MFNDVYRYTFYKSASLEDIQASLLLAVISVESLHGESQAELDVRHSFDEARRTCVIDASTDIGRDLNRLFVGFLRREFDEDAFKVDRVNSLPHENQEVSA